MKFAQVNKILFQNENVAYGVEYERHGKTYAAYVKREVIISAGTVGTSKLIPVVADLPVGENLQDHISVYLGPFLLRRGLGNYFDRDMTAAQFIKYFTLGRGRLTSTGLEASGMISSAYAKARGEADWPDLQLLLYSFTNFRLGPETIAGRFNLKLDDIRNYMKNSEGRDSTFIAVSGARPFSRGYVRLGGNSPNDKPIIDPNYLSDPGQTDFKVLLEGVKKSVYLMENTTAGEIQLGARFTTNRVPGCEHLPFRSDPYWECYIRRFSVTLGHPVGTAAMGSVVDTELRVIATKNLRVIDPFNP